MLHFHIPQLSHRHHTQHCKRCFIWRAQISSTLGQESSLILAMSSSSLFLYLTYFLHSACYFPNVCHLPKNTCFLAVSGASYMVPVHCGYGNWFVHSWDWKDILYFLSFGVCKMKNFKSCYRKHWERSKDFLGKSFFLNHFQPSHSVML